VSRYVNPITDFFRRWPGVGQLVGVAIGLVAGFFIGRLSA